MLYPFSFPDVDCLKLSLWNKIFSHICVCVLSLLFFLVVTSICKFSHHQKQPFNIKIHPKCTYTHTYPYKWAWIGQMYMYDPHDSENECFVTNYGLHGKSGCIVCQTYFQRPNLQIWISLTCFWRHSVVSQLCRSVDTKHKFNYRPLQKVWTAWVPIPLGICVYVNPYIPTSH